MWGTQAIVAVGLATLGCTLGLALTVLRMPGIWVIVLTAGLYGWWSEWQSVPVWLVIVLFGAACVAEALEFVSSAVTVRKVGASRRAAIGALIGGFFGMFTLTFVVPIPIINTVVGALLGCFTGALIGELSVHRQVGKGTRVGLFSMLGFVIGMAIKMTIALGMSGGADDVRSLPTAEHDDLRKGCAHSCGSLEGRQCGAGTIGIRRDTVWLLRIAAPGASNDQV